MCVSFAGFEAAVPDRAMSVGRFDAVSGIACLVHGEEEFFRVAIKSALAGLIGRDFDEGVVATFLAHAQLEISKITGERSGTRGMTAALHPDFREKFIRDTQHVHRHELSSEKVSHVLS